MVKFCGILMLHNRRQAIKTILLYYKQSLCFFLQKKSSNTKITRRLLGVRLSANSKKPQRTQKKDYNDHYFLSSCVLRPLCVRQKANPPMA